MSKPVKWPLPQPLPTTPIRGAGIVRCDFNSPSLRALARRLHIRLNLHHAPIKPKRNSVGLIWRNQVFWWSKRGFYRNGRAGTRRLLQHVLWEAYHGRPVPPGHEVFFRDRDRHNFRKVNLELLTKAECHERIHLLGENPQMSLAARQQLANRRWSRAGAKQTGALLRRFNAGGHTVAATLSDV